MKISIERAISDVLSQERSLYCATCELHSMEGHIKHQTALFLSPYTQLMD